MIDKNKIIEKMAAAGFESQYEENWDNLKMLSIERAMWIETAKAMLKSVEFPGYLYHICRELHLEK